MQRVYLGKYQAKADRQNLSSTDRKNVSGKGRENAGVIGVISDDLAGIGTARVIALIAVAVIPFLIYLWSNTQAVYEYSGGGKCAALYGFPTGSEIFLLNFFLSLLLPWFLE